MVHPNAMGGPDGVPTGDGAVGAPTGTLPPTDSHPGPHNLPPQTGAAPVVLFNQPLHAAVTGGEGAASSVHADSPVHITGHSQHSGGVDVSASPAPFVAGTANVIAHNQPQNALAVPIASGNQTSASNSGHANGQGQGAGPPYGGVGTGDQQHDHQSQATQPHGVMGAAHMQQPHISGGPSMLVLSPSHSIQQAGAGAGGVGGNGNSMELNLQQQQQLQQQYHHQQQQQYQQQQFQQHQQQFLQQQMQPQQMGTIIGMPGMPPQGYQIPYENFAIAGGPPPPQAVPVMDYPYSVMYQTGQPPPQQPMYSVYPNMSVVAGPNGAPVMVMGGPGQYMQPMLVPQYAPAGVPVTGGHPGQNMVLSPQHQQQQQYHMQQQRCACSFDFIHPVRCIFALSWT